MFVCTYAEFLQTDPNLFDAVQFFPVRCLDALFCLLLIPESAQPLVSALYFFWEWECLNRSSSLAFPAHAALLLTYICAGEGRCNLAGCVM